MPAAIASPRRLAARALIVPVLAALPLSAAAAVPRPARAASPTVSSNWAGYAVTRTSFRRVTGSWIVPVANCSGAAQTYSAAWIGLGGFAHNASGLEQTGTDADCTRSGRATYRAWYEVLPDTSHMLRMRVRAGDRLSAAVNVSGKTVSMTLRNRTSRASFRKSVRLSRPDVSSAEWIVEAPSLCDAAGRCIQPRLSDFGTLSFNGATVVDRNGRSGTISSPRWSLTQLLLSEAGQFQPGVSRTALPGAIASPLTGGGSAFAVSYRAAAAAVGKATTTFMPLARRAG